MFGDFRLDISERCLFRAGEKVQMTPKVFDLLVYFVENPGKLLTKDELLNSVWKEAIVEEATLARTVSMLRKALFPEGETALETVPKKGYRFNVDVVLIPPSSDSNQRYPDGAEYPLPVVKKRNLGRPILAAIALLFVAGIVGTIAWYSGAKESRKVEVARGSAIRLTNDLFDEQVTGWTKDGKIRFIRWKDKAVAESFLLDPSTKQVQKDSPFSDFQNGIWSPSGERVVFATKGESPVKLAFVAGSAGQDRFKLPMPAENPAWSADASKLVFQSAVSKEREIDSSDVFVFDMRTRQVKRLTSSDGFDGDPAFSPDGSKIVFVSKRTGDFEVFMMDADGGDQQRITNNSAHDSFPRFTPDGTAILFSSNIDSETTDLYAMRLDGTGLIRLTDWHSNELTRGGASPDGTKIAFNSDRDGNDEVYVFNFETALVTEVISDKVAALQTPAFSRDGKRIVYSAEVAEKKGEIRLLDLDSGKTRVLLKTNSAQNYPQFSPDGKKIAFHQEVYGRWDVFVTNVDGTGTTNITRNAASDSIPNWLPDSEHLLIRSDRDSESLVSRFYSIKTDGTDLQALEVAGGAIGWIRVSIDGNRIVYSCARGGSDDAELDICVASADGKYEKVILRRPGNDMQPVFSPDGKKIAFVATSDGNPEIYLMNSDGTGLIRLTRNVSKDLNPDFSPDGKRIIFAGDRNGKSALWEVVY